MPSTNEIFFSYAWSDEKEEGESREKIVNELYESLLTDNYTVVRDKYDLQYKGFISEFMGKIGQGKCIVVAISKKYVRSPYCMFELYEIARNANFDKHQFREKVLPVMVEFVDFTNPVVIEDHLSYWEDEFNKWDALVKKRSGQLAVDQMQRYDKIKMIHQNFGRLTEWIIDMNTLSPKLLSAENFAEIKKAIGSMAPDVQQAPGGNAKKGSKSATGIAHQPYMVNTDGAITGLQKFLGVQPFFTEIFLGREDDLTAVHQKLFEGNNLLLLVNGEGGIGKTTLAAQYYRKYQDEYRHLAWVFTGNSLADALLTLAMPLNISFPENMPAEERLQELLDALRNLAKPCLLVIDNANDLSDLEAQYQALRRCANFHILLTTRISAFEQAAMHRIEPLEKTAAFELFKKHYPKHKESENELLEKVSIAVGYNTLVMELMAKNLRNFNQLKTHYSLAQLLQDLQSKGLLTLSQTKTLSTAYQAKGNTLRQETLESIIEAMYDLSALTEAESALLSVFAVLPAESIAFETLETLVPVTETLEETLLTLSQKGWLDYNDTSAAFKVSPVIQEITKKKNGQLLQECRGVLSSLVEKLDYEPGIGHFVNAGYEEAAMYARYAESVAGSFEQADEYIAILCERVGNYHQTTGNLNKALVIYEEYSRLGKELYEAYPQNVSFKNGLASSYAKLGSTQASLGNLNKALIFYQQDAQLSKELYEADPQNVSFKNGLAISYANLGLVYEKKQEKDKANEYYQLSFSLLSQLVNSFPKYVEFKRNLEWVEHHLCGD